MFEVKASTAINAPIEIVWQTLTQVENYSQWSTLLHYEGGTLKQGETIQLRLTLPDGPNYSFSPKIIDLQPNRRFAWRAVTGIAGVFDGEHIFELESTGNSQTQLINREIYSGILSPIFKRLPMMKDAPAGFEAMNNEIKTHAEKLAGAI